jgi:hypothetical protein
MKQETILDIWFVVWLATGGYVIYTIDAARFCN